MRTISAYTFIDIILGIFTTLEDAEKAKTQYMTYRKDHDPWRNQAYRESSLDDELRITAMVSLLWMVIFKMRKLSLKSVNILRVLGKLQEL